ncbi:hypothetical protein DPMN_112113 [Dreissena polymorpha]|uniref:Uncharacterized protein n=1 Tax=Dreissena polymorpha TaxID=45954 RepID=A0A9D4KF19_DREPO|nr:hypothetical protein DPMN_112113 [Dreissena polymorpha]
MNLDNFLNVLRKRECQPQLIIVEDFRDSKDASRKSMAEEVAERLNATYFSHGARKAVYISFEKQKWIRDYPVSYVYNRQIGLKPKSGSEVTRIIEESNDFVADLRRVINAELDKNRWIVMERYVHSHICEILERNLVNLSLRYCEVMYGQFPVPDVMIVVIAPDEDLGAQERLAKHRLRTSTIRLAKEHGTIVHICEDSEIIPVTICDKIEKMLCFMPSSSMFLHIDRWLDKTNLYY